MTIDNARAIAASLPRSYEALVRDQVRFRVGRIVYAAFFQDETIMGFAFPRDEREALVASEPDKFLMPRPPTCDTSGSASGSTPSTVALVRPEEGGCRPRGFIGARCVRTEPWPINTP